MTLMMIDLNELLPVILYLCLIILIIVLIVLVIRAIKTLNRVDKVMDDVEIKVSKLDGVFNIVDNITDTVGMVTDKISNFIYDKISGLVSKKKKKGNEEDE